MALAIALNRAVREDDEWFDEPDDLDRVDSALHAIDDIDDAVAAAGVLAYRVARAQAFGEANKRTALLLARGLWTATALTERRLCLPTTASSPTFWSGQRQDTT